MLRFILLVVLGYIVWRLVKAVMTLVMQPRPGKTSQKVHNSSPSKPPQPYVDIQDAEFEEIKSEKNAGEGNG